MGLYRSVYIRTIYNILNSLLNYAIPSKHETSNQ